ncbi:MAG: glycosyltransferase [Polyangiaceae bacterium]|nr:glycosyltransferase [Polyangiaceae bacterium]
MSVVIPVYRSADCLAELMRQLDEELGKLTAVSDFEVICVNDASPDSSWEVLSNLQKQFSWLVAINLMNNVGQMKATLCGLEQARGDLILTMDDDIQHRPDQISKLFDQLLSRPDLDCVLGFFPQKRHARYRNLGSEFIAWMNRHEFKLPKHLKTSSFRLMRRSVVNSTLKHQTANPDISVLIYSSTSRIENVPIEHNERFAGESTYTVAKQVQLAWDNICNVSVIPLRLVAISGVLMSLFATSLVLRALYQYLTGVTQVPGWTTIVILLGFISGFSQLSLGILGEYLVRMLKEVRGDPRYVIRTIERQKKMPSSEEWSSSRENRLAETRAES